MILPSIQGNFHQTGFFIYAAADTRYFDLYGRALINSVLRNTDHGIHIHLYDPLPQHIEFCKQPRVSITWESLDTNQFDLAFDLWKQHDLPEPWHGRKIKMLGTKSVTDNQGLEFWIKKTYYACMRFVRLAEFLDQPRRFLEIDIDGLVRSPFAVEFANDEEIDVYLYEKIKIDRATGQAQSKGHLAGSILFTPKPSCLRFLQDLALEIRHAIESNSLYWFLDQDALDKVIVNYRKGLLSQDYVDWHMRPHSAIWTAKGRRKELDIFQQELAKYQ